MSRKLDKTADTAYRSIARILEEARETAYRAVNSVMVQAYWQIGRVIVEQEQKGRKRADYGKALIAELARRLTENYGKGFTESNLKYMRQFYLTFPISHAVRDELSWTHYRLLLKVEKEDAREFYMLEAAENRWSTRELERQISSLLYERLLMSKDKSKALKQARAEGEHLAPRDIIKDPYVLEFLDVKENSALLEKDLEQGLINKLQEFLLELGRGFAFVARQKRITLDHDHFYIDLVFYNYILKCFVS
jgi:predicted nuclease of restriction endonuclease-like (RecB) superfamily